MISTIEQEGLYQNKVKVSLASIHYCKMAYFSWVLQSSQEKSKTMVMQNLGCGGGGGGRGGREGGKKGKKNEATCKRKLQLPTCWELLRPFANS